MDKRTKTSSIPALRVGSDGWELEPKDKADLFVDTFVAKFVAPVAATHEYTCARPSRTTAGPIEIGQPYVAQVLAGMDVDSGTGPYNIATIVLKQCCDTLAAPFSKLARRIVSTGRWPQIWITHWVMPLHKRNCIYKPTNYRGFHLTSQASKAIERILRTYSLPSLERLAYGEQQFAYRKGRGARDAVAYYALSWIAAFCRGAKVGVYASDVSGAFGKVSADILLRKLASYGMHTDLLQVVRSWLRDRPAVVIIGGERSKSFGLRNMVFQGTVWGPCLWNAFFGDSAGVVERHGFLAVIHADDMNMFKCFPLAVSNVHIRTELRECQVSLHEWGDANAVTFDAGKDHQSFFSQIDPDGNSIRLFGLEFDTKLDMQECMRECVCEAIWRLRTLLRTRRFHTYFELIHNVKGHALSYL